MTVEMNNRDYQLTRVVQYATAIYFFPVEYIGVLGVSCVSGVGGEERVEEGKRASERPNPPPDTLTQYCERRSEAVHGIVI